MPVYQCSIEVFEIGSFSSYTKRFFVSFDGVIAPSVYELWLLTDVCKSSVPCIIIDRRYLDLRSRLSDTRWVGLK